MKFEQAVETMAAKNETTEAGRDIRDEAVRIIVDEVEPLCKTSTLGDTTLEEWISAGSFTGTETPISIAQEWDDLSNQ